MIRSPRPCDNPFNAQRVDALPYLEHALSLDDVMDRLSANNHRGAICGPHGCGKSALLGALTPRLQAKGLRPLQLFMNSAERGRLPRNWRSAIRAAGPSDALLLDGYDLLPIHARGWVHLQTRRVGAVVVTTHRDVGFKTIARPVPSQALLHRLVKHLSPDAARSIDIESLIKQSRGNLRDALRLAYDQAGKTPAPPSSNTHITADRVVQADAQAV